MNRFQTHLFQLFDDIAPWSRCEGLGRSKPQGWCPVWAATIYAGSHPCWLNGSSRGFRVFACASTSILVHHLPTRASTSATDAGAKLAAAGMPGGQASTTGLWECGHLEEKVTPSWELRCQ